MKIQLKCKCGAEAIFEDGRGVFCKGAVGPQSFDAKGRRYLIEVRADEWQEMHAPCLNAALSHQAGQKESGG